MANPRAAAHRRAWPRISLTMCTAVAVFVAGAAGGTWLGIDGARTERVVVVTRDLSGFRAVSAADVTLRKMARSAVPPGAMRSLGSVRGHYVLRPLHAGQIVVQHAVGPPAAAPGLVVVPLSVGNDSAAWIRDGALVDLLLAPTGPGGRAVVIRQVLVVDQRKTAAGGHLVFVAVPRDRECAIARVAGRGRAILAEVPGSGT
ncbi:MAG: hypothetical protein JWL68_2162 [Actinomycetia bacterium]|nr:hypothetical protein [Actinomycetes bacterium]